MKTIKYSIPNMMCGHCVHTIESEIGELTGVSIVKAILEDKSVEVTFDTPASEEQIVATLKEINYPPEGIK